MIYPKCIDVTTPYLTIGMAPDMEQRLGISPGKMIVLSSSGDLELLTIIFSLAIARTSLLETGHEPVRTLVACPSMYPMTSMLETCTRMYVETMGVPSRSTITFVAIKSMDDLVSSIDMIDGFDAYFDVYFDYHLTDVKKIKDAMERLNGKKGGKIMLLNRFNRYKKTVLEHADDELHLQVVRLVPGNVTFIPQMKAMNGTIVGVFTLSTGRNDVKVSYEMRYPYMIR